MTKTQALYNFFNGFGVPAYPTNSVPECVSYPWITYEPAIGNAGDSDLYITVGLWYRTTSESVPNAKVEEIAEAIGRGGTIISYDGGAIWIKRGSPWCNSVAEEDNVKHKSLNVTLTYI